MLEHQQYYSQCINHKPYNIKESKCHLFLQRVNFLGHVVDSRGVSLESGKVDAV
jgi:hypothetical protein